MKQYSDKEMADMNDDKWLAVNQTDPKIDKDLIIDLMNIYGTITSCVPVPDYWMDERNYRLHNGEGYKDGIAIEQKADEEGNAAIQTLARLGYTWLGGEFWKPPVSISGNNAPAWDGEGHPPDGTICEMAIANHTAYRIVLVDYIGIDICVFTIEESGKQGSCSINAALFRPIKSHKQKTLEAATRQITANPKCTFETLDGDVQDVLSDLYDAGFITMPEGDK